VLVLLLGFGFWLTLGCVVGAAVVMSHGWCWLRVLVLVGIWDLVVVLAVGLDDWVGMFGLACWGGELWWVGFVEPESLILAQSERWRNA
jgi:hypothetical protein